MPADAGAVFVSGLCFFDDAVQRTLQADWQRPSPCEGWRAVDVLGHTGAVVRFASKLARGENPAWTPSLRPGDDLHGTPHEWWTEIMASAMSDIEGLDATSLVKSPAGQQTVAAAISFPAVDLYVHAWDLWRSRDADVEIPSDVIHFAHEVIDPMPDGVVRNALAFGPPVAVPATATPSEAFIAWTGRAVSARSTGPSADRSTRA